MSTGKGLITSSIVHNLYFVILLTCFNSVEHNMWCSDCNKAFHRKYLQTTFMFCYAKNFLCLEAISLFWKQIFISQSKCPWNDFKIKIITMLLSSNLLDCHAPTHLLHWTPREWSQVRKNNSNIIDKICNISYSNGSFRLPCYYSRSGFWCISSFMLACSSVKIICLEQNNSPGEGEMVAEC